MDAEQLQVQTLFVRMIAGDMGLTVVEDSEATTFSITEAGLVTIPILTNKPEAFVKMVNGGVFHEGLHGAVSDFTILDKLSPIEKLALGVIEDLRIENYGVEAYPAHGYQLLIDLWSGLYELQLVSRPDPNTDDILYAVMTWLLAYCRAKAVDHPTAIADVMPARQIVESLTSPEAVEAVDDLLALTPTLTSSADSLELARRVLLHFINPNDVGRSPNDFQAGTTPTEIKSEDLPTTGREDGADQSHSPESQGNGEQQPGQESDGSDPRTQGAQNSASSDKQGGNTAPGQIGEGDKPSTSAGSETAADAPSQPSDVPGSTAGAISKSAQDPLSVHKSPSVFGELAEPFEGDPAKLLDQAVQMLLRYAHMQDISESGLQKRFVRVSDSDNEAGRKLLESALRRTSGLRSRLANVLRSVSQERQVYATRGKIDPRRMWRLKIGDPKVFVREVDAISRRTEIFLLNDFSHSLTQGGKSEAVKNCCMSLSLAVEGLPGVSTSWFAFQGIEGACQLTQLKSATETSRMASGRLAAMKPNGTTPLGAAVAMLLPKLKESTADRKILVIESDGEADSLPSAVKQIAEVRAAGVDVIVIGVLCSARMLDGDPVDVSNLDDLPTLIFNRLEALLNKALEEV